MILTIPYGLRFYGKKIFQNEFTEVLGTTYRERINTMVLDIVKHSENLNDIVMSKEVRDAMIGLRKFMFERVYEEPNTKKEEDKIKNIIGPLYEYYLIHS